MKLSDLSRNKLVVENEYSRSLTHPDEVRASIMKSDSGWVLSVLLSDFIPEVTAKYVDAAVAEKAVDDLYTLGILVKGRHELTAEADKERAATAV